MYEKRGSDKPFSKDKQGQRFASQIQWETNSAATDYDRYW